MAIVAAQRSQHRAGSTICSRAQTTDDCLDSELEFLSLSFCTTSSNVKVEVKAVVDPFWT